MFKFVKNKDNVAKKRYSKKSLKVDNKSIWIPVLVITVALTFFLVYNATLSKMNLISLGFLYLFMGLIVESYRIVSNFKIVLFLFLCSYIFSFITFIPGKNETVYNFVSHLTIWPFVLLILYSLSMAIIYEKQITTKITEGTTLLLSISLIYWAFDHGYVYYFNWFSITLIVIGLSFTSFSLFHALTHIPITQSSRLILSIWSAIITSIFAVENIVRIFNNPEIEQSKYFSEGFYVGIQYFLLGISSIYVIQNFMLLINFLPSRNGNYKKELKENKKMHINRFSDQQTDIKQSLVCIVFTGTFYSLNYFYHFLPRYTMIWLIFVTFPIILLAFNHLTSRSNQ